MKDNRPSRARILALALGSLLGMLASTVEAAGTTAAVEYFQTNLGSYFVTASPAEIAVLDASSAWSRTGQTYRVESASGAGLVPVCRFLSAAFAPRVPHFFTADATECARLAADGLWQYEGTAFFAVPAAAGSCTNGGVPLYRLYGGGSTGAPNHRYTTCAGLRDRMASRGWTYEGVAMCVAGASTDCATDHSDAAGAGPAFTTAQTLTDEAQRTTLAFAGLAMMTGNLPAQTFFPPGKVSDYTGFQYLRDNDPDNMGHNTSFLTRVANNVLFILSDAQLQKLKTLAAAQLAQTELYGYRRYPLMKAFRRQLEGDIPAGSTGLDLHAVRKASEELYVLDGEIAFARALLYADVIGTLSPAQRAYLDAMKGKGWNSWPDITDAAVKPKMAGLPQGTAVAVMTYAGDIFSWYAGSLDADVYFCPERHGTYFGSFYIKDAPAVGHEGYAIDEQLTAVAGSALSDGAKGYVTPAQAATISSLVERQRDNLYASPVANIVTLRTQIATLLRSLLATGTSAEAVRAAVLELSAAYGRLDGENNHAYATVFAQVYTTLSAEQKIRLGALRKSIMSGTYADGTPFDYSVGSTYYLYAEPITNASTLVPYVANTDYLFFAP